MRFALNELTIAIFNWFAINSKLTFAPLYWDSVLLASDSLCSLPCKTASLLHLELDASSGHLSVGMKRRGIYWAAFVLTFLTHLPHWRTTEIIVNTQLNEHSSPRRQKLRRNQSSFKCWQKWKITQVSAVCKNLCVMIHQSLYYTNQHQNICFVFHIVPMRVQHQLPAKALQR